MHALLGRVGNFEKGIQTSTWQTLLNFLNAIASLESLVFIFCDFVCLHVFCFLYFWHCLVLLFHLHGHLSEKISLLKMC